MITGAAERPLPRFRSDTGLWGVHASAADSDMRLPAEVPWDVPISELSAFWLHVRCKCGRSSSLPLRLLVADYGWDETPRAVVPHLRCAGMGTARLCGQSPASVLLAESGYEQDREGKRRALRLASAA